MERKYRPFYDGPIDARIARLKELLATPPAEVDRDETSLRLALRVLEQLKAENTPLSVAS
jgi:hypothetical protein